MVSSVRILILTTLGFLALASAVGAQPGRGRGQGGNYDPATETSISGEVSAVDNVTPQGRPGRRGLGGLHLTVKTASESVVVHMGPAAFVKEKNFAVAVGDRVDITGSRVTLEGETVLLARVITKSGQTLTLRDASGRPLWSGARR